MQVLVPMDSSDCSFRALEFATAFARSHDADLDVVHLTDHRTESTADLVERARAVLEREGFEADVDVVIDAQRFRASSHIGKDILELADDRDVDHVVMGHHGTGALGRALLGSAAETVVRSADVPVTVIP